MKIIVTHASPDMDAITSVWVMKKFLPEWDNAHVMFVPAGERIPNSKADTLPSDNPIEIMGKDEVVHVDTGLGPLDHHQTSDDTVCGASRSWEYVKSQLEAAGHPLTREKEEAVDRMVKVVVGYDHFKEVFWEDATADYHEFNVLNILDGLKLQKPNDDMFYVQFVSECLDAILHEFENRIWAEREIRENGVAFDTKYGKGIGFETINDTVIKLAQKMGYVLVLRKDPRKGYVRIKARPELAASHQQSATSSGANQLDASGSRLDAGLNLTLAYEQLKKIDPDATWFLHVSKKMLLNGSAKNPKMKPTKLTLKELIDVLKSI